MVLIKKRNFKPYVLQWLANKLELGLSIGDIYYVATSGGAFETNLREAGVPSSEIFTTVGAAEDATTTGQNDVVMVTPGAFAETSAIAWDKNHTHLVGLAGKNISGDWTTTDSCVVYTSTAAVADVITLTGYGCQFHNLVVENYGADAASVSAVRVGGYGNYFERVAFHGNMTSTQCAAAAAASLYITKDGDHSVFEDCIIGSDVWGTRATANSGQLYFSGTGSGDRPNDGLFRNCQFLSTGTTNTCAMVVIATKNAIGRNWVFDNCLFSNFDEDATAMNRVFYAVDAANTQNGIILLRHCSAQGYTEWQTDDHDVTRIDMPAKANAGGVMAEVTS